MNQLPSRTSEISLSINALLGGLVVSVGAWLAWDGLPLAGVLLILAGAVGFLRWRGWTIGRLWAWATLLLGIESLAWPVVTMVHIRSLTDQPTDDQMGAMLSAMLMGLFSSVFWIAFSYGLFKRGSGTPAEAITPAVSSVGRSKKTR